MSSTWPNSDFPHLHLEDIDPELSPPSRLYNCLGYAAGSKERRWDFGEGDYWPPNVPKEDTVEAFVMAYGSIGYAVTENGELEAGIEKIALYASRRPDGLHATHAALQLEDGRWASKLGDEEDIVHPNLESINGPTYGRPVQFLWRKRV